MPTVNLTQDELLKICQMIENSNVQVAFAEEALALYKKFKNAK